MGQQEQMDALDNMRLKEAERPLSGHGRQLSGHDGKLNWPARQLTWLGRQLNPSAKKRSLPKSYLIVDWAYDGARFAHYQRNDLRPSVSFEVAWTENEKNPTVISNRIADELKRWSIQTNQCIVSMPRRAVVLKNLELPKTDQAPIADLVALQCESIFPVSKDTLVIDFVPHSSAGQGKVNVLVAAVPKSHVHQILQALTDNHLKPLMLTVAELNVARLSGTTEPAMDIIVDHQKIEYSISQDRLPALTYSGLSTENPAERHAAILSTVQRLCTSAQKRKSPLAVRRAHIYGQIEASICKAIERLIGVPSEDRTQHSLAEIRDQALRAAYLAASSSIDFAHPRKPIDLEMQRRRYAMSAVAIASLLAIAIGLPIQWQKSALDQKIAETQRRIAEVEEQVDRIKPLEAKWKKLASFDASKFKAEQVIREVLSFFEPNEALKIESIELAQATSDRPAQFSIKGKVQSRESWNLVAEKLLQATGGYRMLPPKLDIVASADEFPLRFSVDIELKARTGS